MPSKPAMAAARAIIYSVIKPPMPMSGETVREDEVIDAVRDRLRLSIAESIDAHFAPYLEAVERLREFMLAVGPLNGRSLSEVNLDIRHAHGKAKSVLDTIDKQ